MPVYEFYCSDCHKIFSFLSQTVNTKKTPKCPDCGTKKMERKVSMFAISSGREEPDDLDFPDMDEDKMEQAMAALEREADGVNEEDPKAMARLMRKFYESTGMSFGAGMEEAMARMEAGEDPEKVEEEMGDLLEDEGELFGTNKIKKLAQKFRPPAVDEKLYEM